MEATCLLTSKPTTAQAGLQSCFHRGSQHQISRVAKQARHTRNTPVLTPTTDTLIENNTPEAATHAHMPPTSHKSVTVQRCPVTLHQPKSDQPNTNPGAAHRQTSDSSAGRDCEQKGQLKRRLAAPQPLQTPHRGSGSAFTFGFVREVTVRFSLLEDQNSNLIKFEFGSLELTDPNSHLCSNHLKVWRTSFFPCPLQGDGVLP